MKKYDICIIGLKCYDLLTNKKVPRYLGGVERLLVALAKGLSARGKRVAFITYDHGQGNGEIHHNIVVYKTFSPEEGIPVVRFFYPRMAKLWKSIFNIDSSIYLHMGAGAEAGQVAFAVKNILWRKKAKYIFCTASNSDCELSLPLLKQFRERYLYKYALKNADFIITQTISQKNLLKSGFGRNSEVMPLPYTEKNPLINEQNISAKKKHILWIGRIIEEKRLEWILELAKEIKEVQFDVVGTPNTASEYSDQLIASLLRNDNITYHGKVSDEELQTLYLRAYLLCCTSLLEGFPTTFLEAWSYGVPLITSYDPDNIVNTNNLGKVVGNIEDMRSAIESYLSHPDLRNKASIIARKYYAERHSPSAQIEKYENLINKLTF